MQGRYGIPESALTWGGVQAAFAKYECFIRTQSTSDVFEEGIMTRAFEDLFRESLIVRIKESKSVTLVA